MRDLIALPNKLDKRKLECRAVIETPKGRRNKFNYDPDSGLFELAKLLPEGMIFPFDFGFVPSTLGDDGDPLDVLVLMDEPAHVGCLLEVRILGVIEADQTEEGRKQANHRLLGAAVNSYSYENTKSLDQLSRTMLAQLEQFFASYNKVEGKQFDVTGRGGPERALEIIQQGIDAYSRKQA